MKARKTVFALSAALLVAFAVSGCVTEPVVHETHAPFELNGVEPDFGEKLASCLNDSGWEVTVSEDGGVTATIPEASDDIYSAAVSECTEKLGIGNPPPLSDTQARKLYTALVQLSDCLRDEGYTIDNVPSEQAFLDGTVFDPYGEIYGNGEIAGADFADLHDTCPQP
ncbi:hypothetical protein G3H63_01805 [Microbacterium resistens]|uniref:hypothetical protein n=1 Tax=Microbacterium resistens TaxID=156977 RepID=UPI001C57F6B1|nr:hypothetical protein [Microbacterium resistens]MBW1637822.1 hypothetical protein [Microbacterium resistens]